MPRRIDQAGPTTRYLEEVAKKIAECLIGGARADYNLGRIVDEVIVGHYWSREDWPGAPAGGWPDTTEGFKQWCWEVLGFKYRKAYHFRNIYLALSAMDLNETGLTFVRVLRQGWSKVTLIVREARTEERLVYWLDRCEHWWCRCGHIGSEGECPQCGDVMQRPLTENALKAEIAIALGNDDADDGGDDGADDTRDSAGASSAAPASSETSEKKTTRVEFPLVFEDADAVRMFIAALDIVRRRTGTDSNGKAAARMAAAYLASTPHEEEGGLVMELEQMIQIIEAAWGVTLHVDSGAPEGEAPTPTPTSDPPSGAGRDAALEGFG